MDASKIIDLLGGTRAVSIDCGVTDGAISQWRNNGIPHPWVKYLVTAYPEMDWPALLGDEKDKYLKVMS